MLVAHRVQCAAVNTEPTVTRAELITDLAVSNPHLRPVDAELIVATIFDQITAALARRERVELRGFGAFLMRRRSARVGKTRPFFRYCLCTEGLNSRRSLSCISGSGQGAVDWLLAPCAAYRFDVLALTIRH